MGFLDEIKLAVQGKALDMFKVEIKKKSAEQIIDIIFKASQDTAASIFKDLEKGKPIEEIKKKWILEVKT